MLLSAAEMPWQHCKQYLCTVYYYYALLGLNHFICVPICVFTRRVCGYQKSGVYRVKVLSGRNASICSRNAFAALQTIFMYMYIPYVPHDYTIPVYRVCSMIFWDVLYHWLFCGNMGLFCRNIRLFCGNIGLFCGNIGLFSDFIFLVRLIMSRENAHFFNFLSSNTEVIYICI